MKVINSADVTEYDTHEFSAEASSLGLKPGEWPEQMETTLGNKLNFYRDRPFMNGEELGGALYKQIGGCITLKVYND